MMSARSVSDARATTSAAVGPSWPIRMSSGPSRRNEKPRSAWSSCIEETPTSITTPSTASRPSLRTDVGEIGKAILDQRQPAIRTIDQIGTAGDRRCGRDRCRPRGFPARPGSRGCSRRRQRWRRHRCRRRAVQELDRLAAEHGDMMRRGRDHAPRLRRIAVQGTGVGHETAHHASNARASRPFRSWNRRSMRADPVVPGRKPGVPTGICRQPWEFEPKAGLGRLGCRFGSSPLSNGP